MVDWTKPIQTKSGRKASYVGKTGHEEYPMDVLVHCIGGPLMWTFTEEGKLLSSVGMQSPLDLVNVEPSRLDGEQQ